MENTVNIPGIGEVVKSDYVITLDLEDTFLLTRMGNPMSPKIWVTKAEWEGRVVEEPEPPEEMPKFGSFNEALEAFSAAKEEKLKKGELEEFKEAPEGCLYPLDELEKLRLDELLIIITMAYGEKAVRKKLYAMDGHEEKDADS